VKALVKQAKTIGVPAFALTDRANMHGAFEFSKAALDSGGQPIIGCEMALGFDTTDKQKNDGTTLRKYGTLVFLAQSERGYINICTLLSHSHRPSPEQSMKDFVPALDPEQLSELTEDVILLSGGQDGLLYEMLRNGEDDMAFGTAHWLSGLFRDRFFIQICRNATHVSKEEAAIEKKLLDIAYSQDIQWTMDDGTPFTGIPVVASSAVFYADTKAHEAWEILNAVQHGKFVNFTDNKMVFSTSYRYHLRTAEEMAELFADLPEALENTVAIAQRCAFKVSGRQPILPPFPTESGRTEAEELRAQSYEGLEMRLERNKISETLRPQYVERLEYELGIIEKMGFPGYFLIVSDFIKWAKAHGIPVGPGRGSGAGSLVAYSLQITDLDPFRFGLLFERFLNPERVSMPDFDVDFCQDRRGEVIKYVQEKYGVDMVAQIANFGEIKSKTAIKDAARVIMDDRLGGFSYGEVNELTKLIPKKEDAADPKPLLDAIADTPELQTKVFGLTFEPMRSNEDRPAYLNRIREEQDRLIAEGKGTKLALLWQMAAKIEGLYRSQGLHAAGVVVGDRPLHELIPVGFDTDTGMPVCQFNMKSAEPAGMVKFDFLGLKTLSVIVLCVHYIKLFKGIDVDVSNLPLDDQGVYEMLAKGRSNGVFQFESNGMKGVLRDVKPTRIEDLIAINALFRPGPMEMIPHFAACKNGTETPEYPDPIERTKPFLEETFGIMVYQEQVMKVAQEVAGYSLGGADLLRRAMGKKIKEEMDKERAKFVQGATQRGTSKDKASELFDHIAAFAGYGFNKSHAAAYAWIAYQTAWLKYHYPAEFFSALMTYEIGHQKGPERMALIKDDMDEMGIVLLPPDVNKSGVKFQPEACETSRDGWAVRFGLSAIKGISADLSVMIKAREKGPFKSLEDFHKRARGQFNKGQVEKVAEAGGFDCLTGGKRHQAVSVLSYLEANSKGDSKQISLFADEALTVPPKIKNVEEWGDLIDREFKAVGFYFNNHPLDGYKNRLVKAGVRRYNSFLTFMQQKKLANLGTTKVWVNGKMENDQNDPLRKLCGMVSDVRLKQSENSGNYYLTISIAEKEATYYVSFYAPRRNSGGMTVDEARSILETAKTTKKPVILECELTLERENSLKVIARKVNDVDSYLNDVRGNFTITLSEEVVRLDVDEMEALDQARVQQEEGTITEAQFLETEAAVRLSALKRRITALKEFLDTVRDDETASAVEVTLQTEGQYVRSQAKKLHGFYRLNGAIEAHIKTLDGVVSVSES
jgi:DNA polymerase-3 subunit alpha